MRQNALTFLFAFIVLAFLAWPNPGISQEAGTENPSYAEEYTNVIAAARKDAPAFLNLIPPGREHEFGFDHPDQIKGASLGNAYQVMTPSPAFYRGEQQADGREIIEAGEWWVVVRNGDRNALVLVVFLVDEAWQVVSMGMKNQALELESFEKTHPARQREARILRVYPLQADFILSLPDTAYPMMAARKAFPGMMDKSSFSPEELLQWLKIRFMQF